MQEFRIIIAGSRDMTDYDFLEAKMDNILANVKDKYDITVISGHCVDKDGNPCGADHLGELYANKRGYDLEMYPANFKRYGKPGGPIRNRKMAKLKINAAVVFYNGFSKGSKDMVTVCKEFKIPLREVIIKI
jgi:hypothetical protein